MDQLSRLEAKVRHTPSLIVPPPLQGWVQLYMKLYMRLKRDSAQAVLHHESAFKDMGRYY